MELVDFFCLGFLAFFALEILMEEKFFATCAQMAASPDFEMNLKTIALENIVSATYSKNEKFIEVLFLSLNLFRKLCRLKI